MENGNQIRLETSAFTHILGQEDTNLQDALETLDHHSHGGGGGWLHRFTGTWYGPVFAGALTPATVTANSIYYLPFLVENALALNGIGIYVTTSSASTNARLGIYNDSNSLPTSLLLDAGVVSTNIGGLRSLAINQVLQADRLYWLAVLFSGPPAVKHMPSDSLIHHLGHYTNNSFNARIQGFNEARAYASGLVATATPILLAAAMPFVCVKW